jgi:hypothetical protein
MAITNTRSVSRIEVYPAADADSDPRVMVVYEHVFDDSNDDALPVTSHVTKLLSRYTVTVSDDGTEASAATSVAGEDTMVQDICGAVWTD